jgi:translocation protein SEC62
MSTMTYVLAGLGALAVVLICLFPVAPMWVKAGVVYIASGLLAAIMAVLILRSVIALASYVGTGRTVWILPNVLADDKPLSELFNPLVAVQEPPARDSTLAWAKHLGVRLVVGGLAAAFVMVLLRNAPDRDTVRREAGRYRDELFDLLKVNDRKLLSQGKNETKGSAAGNDSVPPPAQGGGEEGNDQREEEL